MEEERIRPYVPAVHYWLLGRDPRELSYADLERQPSRKWDGVTDYVALKFLRDIDAGDEALLCETGDEPRIVGRVRVISDPYPDPQQDDPAYMAVDIEAAGRLAAPVPLDDLLDDPGFQDLDLEDLGELAVVPLDPHQWERILELSRERAEQAGDAAASREGVLVGEEEEE